MTTIVLMVVMLNMEVAINTVSTPQFPTNAARKAARIAILIGALIRIGRLERRWSEQEAAERANISRGTLRKIEAGNTSVAAGSIYALCALLSVPLFEEMGERDLEAKIKMAGLRLEALPKRIREGKEEELDDGF
ncbi:helix-turn-helix transcriptional regulator [Telmatospirillum sp.]|uniref:helix-turn-helix domain-containing protein n=1 Tax=Telmatospirillum sp. TaxID=2079197 RepID=UPI002845645F|nr:helix-turn-helix transcriptional regulator [Telmatospirillum sp.]MDR3440328.1 helix-turn-helix transcriptional regulator [Telmatospirillum sp.]